VDEALRVIFESRPRPYDVLTALLTSDNGRPMFLWRLAQYRRIAWWSAYTAFDLCWWYTEMQDQRLPPITHNTHWTRRCLAYKWLPLDTEAEKSLTFYTVISNPTCKNS